MITCYSASGTLLCHAWNRHLAFLLQLLLRGESHPNCQICGGTKTCCRQLKALGSLSEWFRVALGQGSGRVPGVAVLDTTFCLACLFGSLEPANQKNWFPQKVCTQMGKELVMPGQKPQQRLQRVFQCWPLIKHTLIQNNPKVKRPCLAVPF